jgi:LacI family transcriptional regulator, repressor for deo operon, udp, cdd, tsx, nupC, and nupG
MSSIDQVALLAKVSVATVSRVINNSGSVSPETRQRVLAAVERLKYQPNAMGSLLRKEHTGMILVMLHSVDNPFFSPIVQGIESYAQTNGMNVLISTTYGDPVRENHYLELVKTHFVDGILLIANTMTLEMLNELSSRFPVVQVLEYLEDSEASRVTIDFYAAAAELVEGLVAKGHRHIAFVHTGLEHIISTQKKRQAYGDVLNHHGLATYEIPGPHEFGFDSGARLASILLKQHPQITAFFATSDLIALGTLSTLERLNHRVPEDMAVVSFDNTVFATLSKPTLTSVDVNGYELGVQAMDYLHRRIHQKKYRDRVCLSLPYAIHHRNSE